MKKEMIEIKGIGKDYLIIQTSGNGRLTRIIGKIDKKARRSS